MYPWFKGGWTEEGRGRRVLLCSLLPGLRLRGGGGQSRNLRQAVQQVSLRQEGGASHQGPRLGSQR